MGRTKQKPGAHCKIKKYKRGRDTKRRCVDARLAVPAGRRRDACARAPRNRDVDQIFDDVKRIETVGPQVIPYDEDLPGGGQFYCARSAGVPPKPPRARRRLAVDRGAAAGRDGQALRGPEGPRRP